MARISSVQLRLFGRSFLFIPAMAVSIALFIAGPVSAATFTDGQRVEVREGDSWSPATILKHEGRRYQIHYQGGDASTDEWVAADRLRAAGEGGASGSTTAPAGGTEKPAPAKENPWVVGQKVEAKYGGTWGKAVVVKKQGAWTMLRWDTWRTNEWVEPQRIRKLGSKEDNLGFADWNPRVEINEAPPSPEPGVEGGEEKEKDKDKRAASPFSIPNEGVNGLPLTEADRASGKTIVPGEASPKTAPAADNPLPKANVRPVALHDQGPGGELSLVVNPSCTFAMITNTPRGSAKTTVNFERCDLAAGQTGAVTALAPNVRVLAISPDGSKLLTRSEKFFGGTKWRVDLWSISAGTAKAVLSFRPYEAKDEQAAVEWARFLDNDRVLTCGGGNQLTLWQLSGKQPKAVYTIGASGELEPTISAGGKYIVLASGKMIYLCDTASGQTVAQAPLQGGIRGAVSLRADARQLAIFGGHRLVVIDLSDGTVQHDIGLPPQVRDGQIDWVGADQVLLQGTWLFDLPHRSVAWTYTGDAGEQSVVAGRLFYTTTNTTGGARGRQTVLASTPVPDTAAQSALGKLPQGETLVRDGSKVALSVEVNAPEDVRQKIVKHLTKQLEAAGVTIADGQPVTLKATSATADSQEMSYRRIGGAPSDAGEKVSVTRTRHSVAFVFEGKPAWELSSMSGGAPGMLRMNEGESIRDAAGRQGQPTYDWFLTTSLPSVVLKPRDPLSFGSSTLTATGAKEMKK